MPTPLISPNLHVILIHYPLAMLIAGTLIELFSFMWRRSTFRVAGRWMILIGALSAFPAVFSGIYALRDIARVDSQARWADLKIESPVLSQPEIWQMLRNHMLYQSITTGLAALVVVVWLGCSDRARKSLHFVFLILLLFAVGIMIRAAWFGGETIYRHGVAVEKIFPIAATVAAPTTGPTSWLTTPTKVEMLFPPMELHTIMAGITTAIALAAIGLSFRKITATYEVAYDHPEAARLPPAGRKAPPHPPTSVAMVRTFNPDIEVEVVPFVPAGRFWLLTFVLALSTALGGIFILSRSADLFTQAKGQPKEFPKLVWEQIRPDPGQKVNRLVVHAAAGTAILVLPLIMALLVRFAPRERLALLFFTLLLIAAISAQVWLGILLLFDTTEGPINHFNPPTAMTAAE